MGPSRSSRSWPSCSTQLKCGFEALSSNISGDHLERAKESARLAPFDPYLDRQHELSLVEKDLVEHRQRLATRTYTGGERAVARQILEHALTFHPAGDLFGEFCHGLLRARAESLRIYGAMLEGRYDDSARGTRSSGHRKTEITLRS